MYLCLISVSGRTAQLCPTCEPPLRVCRTRPQLSTGRTKAEVAAEVASMRWGDFKPKLADALVEHLRPIQTR